MKFRGLQPAASEKGVQVSRLLLHRQCGQAGRAWADLLPQDRLPAGAGALRHVTEQPDMAAHLRGLPERLIPMALSDALSLVRPHGFNPRRASRYEKRAAPDLEGAVLPGISAVP